SHRQEPHRQSFPTRRSSDLETPSGDAYEEKFNLLMGSGDYSDAFFGGDISTGDQMKYGDEDILIPLEDLIDNYAPNFQKLLDERSEEHTSELQSRFDLVCRL